MARLGHCPNLARSGNLVALEENAMKSQTELDSLIRTAKGSNAVAELVQETKTFQVYVLSDGSTLAINKRSGRTLLSQLNPNGFDPCTLCRLVRRP